MRENTLEIHKTTFSNLKTKNQTTSANLTKNPETPPGDLMYTSALEYKVLQFCAYDIRILTFHIQMQHVIAKLSKLVCFTTNQ